MSDMTDTQWVGKLRSGLATHRQSSEQASLEKRTQRGQMCAAPGRRTRWMEVGSIILWGQKSHSGDQILPRSTCALPFTCRCRTVKPVCQSLHIAVSLGSFISPKRITLPSCYFHILAVFEWHSVLRCVMLSVSSTP